MRTRHLILRALPLFMLTNTALVHLQRDPKNVGRAAQLEPFLIPLLFFLFLRRRWVARCRGFSDRGATTPPSFAKCLLVVLACDVVPPAIPFLPHSGERKGRMR